MSKEITKPTNNQIVSGLADLSQLPDLSKAEVAPTELLGEYAGKYV